MRHAHVANSSRQSRGPPFQLLLYMSCRCCNSYCKERKTCSGKPLCCSDCPQLYSTAVSQEQKGITRRCIEVCQMFVPRAKRDYRPQPFRNRFYFSSPTPFCALRVCLSQALLAAVCSEARPPCVRRSCSAGHISAPGSFTRFLIGHLLHRHFRLPHPHHLRHRHIHL